MKRTNLPKKNEKGMAKPPKWSEGRLQQVYNLALLGLTDIQIAEELDIAYSTFEYWKRTKPELYRILKMGKTHADSQVAAAMYNNAIGYWYDDVQIMPNKVTLYDENGTPTKSYTKPLIIPIKKYVLPETKAQIKWLSVRQREKWLESSRVDIHATQNIQINQNIDFSDLSIDELLMLEKIGVKQLQIT